MNIYRRSRIYIRKHIRSVLLFLGILITLIVVYIYASSYLQKLLRGTVPVPSTEAEQSVMGDEVSLSYRRADGAGIRYSSLRTQTEENATIIQSYAPRLVYFFADAREESVFMRAEYGAYYQEEKKVELMHNVGIRYAGIDIRSSKAEFFFDTDEVIFPEGAVIDTGKNIQQAKYMEWNIVTNVVKMNDVYMKIIARE